MSKETQNSKREYGWLSDRGREKLNRVLDAYFQVKCKENKAKPAGDRTKLRRILRDELGSLLAAEF